MSQPSYEIWWIVIIGTASLLLLAGGIIASILYSQRKLHAQHREQVAKLTESESRFRKLFEFSTVPMAVSIDGFIIYANEEMLKLLGADEIEDISKRSTYSFILPEFQNEIIQRRLTLNETNSNGNHSNDPINTKISTLKGHVRDVQITAMPITFYDHRALHIVMRDVTAEKEAENRIKYALSEAEKAEKLKSAFIANMSHEIRTPLNIIMGYSSVICEAFADRIKPDEHLFFESIERGSERLMKTIDAILNISRLEAGDITLSKSEVKISPYIEKIVLDLKPIADQKSIRLQFTSDVPNHIVSLDTFLMEQAISNLIDNALKYTKKGSVNIHLKQDVARDLILDIHDTGIGISEEYLPHIFEPYTQEDIGFSRAYEGIGLGLSLVKKITELHNAEIKVKSSKGSGTTFTIIFRDCVTKIEIADKTISSHAPSNGMVINLTDDRKIKPIALVVEDDAPTLQYMRHILKDDYIMHDTDCESETWDFLNAHRVDIILMDISLRDETDGLQITREIRQHEKYKSIPIIAVTAHAFPADRKRCLDAGCNDYLPKPIKKDLLLEKMAKQLVQRN